MVRALSLYLFLSLSMLSQASPVSPQGIVLQGTILNPSGVPVVASSVAFTIEIHSADINNCLLYLETHTLNMSGSGGAFSLTMGSGVRGSGDFHDTSTIAQVFSNSATTMTPLTCATAATSYAPSSGDSRKVIITFDDGNGPQTLTQTLAVQAVPYALYADKLEGKAANEFIQVNTTSGKVLSQANLESVFASSANMTELMALINGTSSSFSGGSAPTFTGPVTVNGDLNTTGNVGIGTASPAAKLDVLNTHLAATSSTGERIQLQVTSPSNTASDYNGLKSELTLKGSSNYTASPYGNNAAWVNAFSEGSGNTSQLNAARFQAYNTGPGTVTDMAAVRTFVENNGGGTITNSYGVRVENAYKYDGTMTNVYGVYIAGQTAGTNNYSLYAPGVSPSYFGGKVGIGTTSPATALDIGAGNFRSGDLIISGTPRAFANPIVIDSITPKTFIYNDSTYNTFRIGTQSTGPSNIALMVAEQDVMMLSATTFYPAPARDNLIDLGGSGRRWKSFTVGTGNAVFGGRVGVGTTSPTSTLDLRGPSSAAGNADTALNVLGGDSTFVGGTGGGVTITAGNGSANSGKGGALTLTGGATLNASTGTAGSLVLGGAGTTATGSAGATTLTSGNGNNGYDGGLISITAGRGTGEGYGGSIAVAGGSYGGGNGIGGDVTILGGAKTNSGSDGNVLLATTRGNVGIGTVSPVNRFSVSGSANISGSFAIGTSAVPTHGFEVKRDTIYFSNSAGFIPYFYANGANITLGGSSSAGSKVGVQGNASVGNSYFLLAAPVSGMIIEGNVGIGTSGPGYKLDVNGDINIAAASKLKFAGTDVCSASGCTSSSDLRLKRNISSLENSLDKILTLQGVEYDWINTKKFGDQHQIGLVAQDLEKVFPEVVVTDPKSGLKSVAYDHLVAPLIESVKEIYKLVQNLMNDNDQQQVEINQLKEENAQLKARLENLEKAILEKR